MHSPEKIFRERLPSHGYATDDLQYGLGFMPQMAMLQRAIIQYNCKHSIGWLAYDVDSTTARFDWYDDSCPPPNILIINPDNGHAHLLYALEKPVHNYAEARDKPLRYLASVDVALTEALHADRGFSKLVCKNPLHDKWEVLYPRMLIYTLDELASWVDLNKYKDKRRRLPPIGLGRNCTLFETLRIWAYRARRQPYLSEELFHAAVLNHAYVINQEFTPPLPHSEIRSTAKSVARWTWRKMSPEGFIAYQRAMGKRSGAVRKVKSMDLRQQILEATEQCPNLVQADIAAMMGVSRETVNRHLRSVTRTISDKYSYSDGLEGNSKGERS